MEWFWDGLGIEAFASNLSMGVWLSALGGSTLFAVATLVASIGRGRRRIVRTLRYATIACVVEFMGLAAMLLIDNPGKWELGPWLLSLMPFVLATIGVAIASMRGDRAPRPALARTHPVPVDAR